MATLPAALGVDGCARVTSGARPGVGTDTSLFLTKEDYERVKAYAVCKLFGDSVPSLLGRGVSITLAPLSYETTKTAASYNTPFSVVGHLELRLRVAIEKGIAREFIIGPYIEHEGEYVYAP